MSFQDLWNKFPLIFGQLCDKKTCAFVVMRIGKKVENSINFSVCSLHFVPGLQSAFCTWSAVCILYWLDWYFCFCSSEPRVRTEILELEKKHCRETILAATVDMWTACYRAHEEKYNDAPLRGHSVCWKEPTTGPLGVNISASRFKLHFQKFGNVTYYLY